MKIFTWLVLVLSLFFAMVVLTFVGGTGEVSTEEFQQMLDEDPAQLFSYRVLLTSGYWSKFPNLGNLEWIFNLRVWRSGFCLGLILLLAYLVLRVWKRTSLVWLSILLWVYAVASHRLGIHWSLASDDVMRATVYLSDLIITGPILAFGIAAFLSGLALFPAFRDLDQDAFRIEARATIWALALPTVLLFAFGAYQTYFGELRGDALWFRKDMYTRWLADQEPAAKRVLSHPNVRTNLWVTYTQGELAQPIIKIGARSPDRLLLLVSDYELETKWHFEPRLAKIGEHQLFLLHEKRRMEIVKGMEADHFLSIVILPEELPTYLAILEAESTPADLIERMEEEDRWNVIPLPIRGEIPLRSDEEETKTRAPKSKEIRVVR